MKFDFRFKATWEELGQWMKKNNNFTVDGLRNKVQDLFSKKDQGLLDWNFLWKKFDTWVMASDMHSFDVQMEQIEFLIKEQIAELDEPVFILVFYHKGQPAVNTETMSYWTALSTKKNLEGDENGVGGDEDMDKITIVNLKRILC